MAKLCAFIYAYACISFETGAAFSTVTRSVTKAPVSQRNEFQSRTEIELPEFELLFERIQMASPLAKLVMEGNSQGGFDAIDDKSHFPELQWKKVEANERSTVHRIDKVERFQAIKTPLLRFRATINGPCLGEKFSNFIMDLEERKKWDDQIAYQEELYPIDDVGVVDEMHGDVDRFGKCVRVGVGYVRTKQGILSPREQLIIGGHQEFKDGSTILWGTEMEEFHNYLLPPGQRHTRAKSHMFAATLAPTSDTSFDIEYLLQMDVGGGIPNFITTPAIADTVKKLFTHAKDYFESDQVNQIIKSQEEENYNMAAEIITSDLTIDNILDENTEDVHPHHHALRNSESLLFTP